MMIAPVIVRSQFALAVDRAPKFAAPDDQRVVQQPALFQILNQRRARPDRYRGACPWNLLRQVRCAGPSRDGRAG